jgi:hypothetical protein
MRGNQRNANAREPGQSAQFRRTALASACALAVGTFAGGAYAQSLVYTLTTPTAAYTPPAATHTDQVTNDQENRNASTTGTNTNLMYGATLPGSIVVNNNSALAQAIGNEVSYLDATDPTNIDLFVVTTGGGAGILSNQIRSSAAGTAVITRARNTNVDIGLIATAQPSTSSIPVTNNSITSQVLVNSADSRIVGDLPASLSTVAGGITTASLPALGTLTQDVTTAGTLNINNAQTSYNASGRSGSDAQITTSSVTVSLTDAASPTNAITVTGNTMGTSFGVNTGTNLIQLTSGGAPTFTNSAVVANAQSNLEDATGGTNATGPVANVTSANAGITVDTSLGAATNTVLGAGLVLSNNAITSSNTGNVGTSAITSAVDVNGATAATSAGFTAGAGGASPAISAAIPADLAVANFQRNDGTFLNATVRAPISATVDTIGAGSITNSLNTLASAATGNSATNAVLAANASHDATVVVGNVQANNLSYTEGITASVITTAPAGGISVNVGRAGSSVTGQITTTQNLVTANAAGSAASNTVDVDTSTFNSVTSTAAGGQAAANITTNTATARAGTMVANVQTNVGAATNFVDAQVSLAGVSVNARDIDGGSGTLEDLSAAQVTATNNAITTSATGMAANNSISTSGASGTLHLAVANVQNNQVNVRSRTQDSGVTVNATSAAASSAISVNDNTVSASVLATDAVNRADASFSNMTTAAASNPAATTAATITANTSATANAVLSIGSFQNTTATTTVNTSNTLADGAGGGFATVALIGAATSSSSLTVTDNAVGATNRGNRVDNALDLPSTTNLTLTGGAATNILSIANAQTNAATADQLAEVSNTSTTAVGIAFTPSLTTVPATVTQNRVDALTMANEATNSVTAAGGILQPTTSTATGATGVNNVNAEFALANTQAVTGAFTRSSNIATSNVGVNLSGTGVDATISGSTVTVTGNTLASEARNNDAANTVGLAGYSALTTTAGLANQQSAASAVAGNVTNSRAGVLMDSTGTDSIASSPISINQNTISGLAVGSSASNGVSVSADNALAGNSTVGATGTAQVTGGVTPTATADYTLANQQSQDATVSSVVAATTRLEATSAAITGTAATPVTVATNTITGTARATDAVNTLTLNGTGSVTAATGALGSGQTGSGAITASVAPAAGSDHMVGVDAVSITTVPVTVTGNAIGAAASRNFASNTGTVTGGTITGRGVATAGQDFTVSNTQSYTSGAVTADADAGTVGAVADLLSGNTTTVTSNAISSGANQNTSANLLTIDGQAAVTASALTFNSQAANSDAVTARVGNTTPLSIGTSELTAATGVLNAATVIVRNNASDASASRNSASTGLDVSGNTIAGTVSATAASKFTASNLQNMGGDVTASQTVTTVGAQAGVSSTAGEVTVTENSVTSSARGNTTTGTGTSVTLTANQSVIGSGLATSNQGFGAATASVIDGNVGGNAVVGLSLGAAGTSAGTPVTVNRNLIDAEGRVNTATTSITVSGVTVTGDTNATLPAATRASFMAENIQDENATAAGSTNGSVSLDALGAQGAAFTGTNVLTANNNQLSATGRGNQGTTSATLTATSTLSGSGMARSTQTSTTNGANMADVSVNNGIGQIADPGAAAATSNNSTVTTNNNLLQADSVRNVATTTLATATTTTTTGTIVGAGAAALLADGAPASFTALNSQTVTAGAAGSTAGVSTGAVGISNATLTGTHVATVADNASVAMGGDNSATTIGNVIATGAVSGSAMATSTQSSLAAGSVQGIVSSGNFGVAATTAAATVTSTVTGNTSTAQAFRNSAATGLAVSGGTLTGDVGAALVADATTPAPASFSALNVQSDNATGQVNSNNSRAVAGLTVTGNLTGASTAQTTSNVDLSLARANSSTTSAQLAATGTLSGSGMASNTQTTSTAAIVQADLTPDLYGARVTGAVTTSLGVTVNSNTALGEAVRNVASTSLTATGIPITGAVAADLIEDGAPASFTAFNSQTENAASTGSSAQANSGVGFGADITGALAGTSAVSVNNNALVARAGTNSATTSAALTSAGTITSTAMATSTQTAASGTGGSTATAVSSLYGLRANSTVAVPVTATDNQQTAQAISNAAATDLTVSATTVTGYTAFATGTTSSFTARNTQTDGADDGASATNTYGTIGANITNTAAGILVTASDNVLEGIARSNSAGTSNTITADSTFSGSAFTQNTQTAQTAGGVNITHTGGTIGLTASVATTATVTASGNTATSEGIRNYGINALTVDAGAAAGTAQAGSTATGSSFRATNVQTETAAAAAGSVIGNTIGTIGAVTTGDMSGTIVASGNSATSRGRANSADTTLDVTAAAALSGSGRSANDQSTTTTTNLGAALTITTVGANSGEDIAAASTITATTNTLTSEARRNVSNNAMTFSGVTVTGETDLFTEATDANLANRPASFTAYNLQDAANGAGTTTATATLTTLGARLTQDIQVASRVTVSDNAVTALAGGNVSTQSGTINGTNTITGSALVDSTQNSLTGAQSATTTVTTAGANVGSDILAATPVTATNNSFASDTLRNSASNTLTINGTSVTGATAAQLMVPTRDTPASFTTRNAQNTGAAASSTSTVTTLGVTVGATVVGAGNNYTVGDNLVSARAGSNSAANATNLGGVSTFDGTAATLNTQNANAGSTVAATVSTTTVGALITGNSTATDSVLAVNRNELNATAVQNTATNSLSGAGASMVSNTGIVTGTASAYSVGNTQTAADTATATNTYVTLGLQAANATGTGNTYSVTENDVFARTGANAAGNTVTLQPASGLGNTVTSSVDSSQTSSAGAILSQINAAGGGVVGVAMTAATGAMAASTPITVSNNMLSAEATRNSATNVLNAVGPSIAGGLAPAHADATFTSLADATPSTYAVRNGQTGTGDVTSVNFGGLIGARLNTGGNGMTFGVVDNTVLAMATMNASSNRLTLDSSSALSGHATNGTGTVANEQISGGSTVSGTAGGFSGASTLNIGVVPVNAAATLGTSTPVTVTGNLVSAQGGGNTSSNTLEAGATSSIAGSTQYTYAALNTQTNAAAVNMNVQNVNIGVFVPTSATIGTGSALTVTGNAASAIGYGNNATNRVAISGLAGGVSGSAQIVNTQTNTASITAAATGLNIGFQGAAGLNNGSSIVSNNSVTSRAVGNSATNGIVQK